MLPPVERDTGHSESRALFLLDMHVHWPCLKTGSARPTSLKAVPVETKSRPCRGWAGVWACGPGRFLSLTDGFLHSIRKVAL